MMLNSRMLKDDIIKCAEELEKDKARLQTKIDSLEYQTRTLRGQIEDQTRTLRGQIEDLKNQNSILSSDFSELQKSIKLSEDVSFYADCYVQLQNECESTLSHKCNELSNLYKQHVECDTKFIVRFKVLLLLMLIITVVTSSLAATLTYHAYDLNNKLNETQTKYKDAESNLDSQTSLYSECTSKVDALTLQVTDKSNQLNACISDKKSSVKSDSKTIRAR